MMGSDGKPCAAAYGPVPFDTCPAQVARDGEDYSVFMLQFIAFEVELLHCDCQGTLGCVESRAGALAPSNERAQMWEAWWAHFEDGVAAKYVKAHTR